MAIQSSLLLCLITISASLLSWSELSVAQAPATNITRPFNRTSFPPKFVFGASSAAYQYEGAAFVDGKGLSIWDNFTHKYPGKITDGSNGDVGDDFYYRYKEDIQLMKFYGLDAFRLSISWARVLPHGKLSKGVNQKGIEFYNSVINELLANGIKPFVTIFHFDVPQDLEDEYGGFLSPLVVNDYVDFAELCFKEFGDRVKHWASSNEPYVFSTGGYEKGTMAPGRCSAWMNNDCPAGDSATEPYIAAHHVILCHAAAAKVYREKYKPKQKGYLGIVLNPNWFVPYSSSTADHEASQRALDFMYGWFLDPFTYGDYPKSMRDLVGDRLPKFTPEESALVKGSLDYLGINYYTSQYAASANYSHTVNVTFTTDSNTNLTSERNGHFIGAPTGVSIFYAYPRGLREILVYTKYKYNDPVIYILECGMGDANISKVEIGVNDTQRVGFYHRHILAVKSAIEKGVRVKGFFAWTFMDTFEWSSGFTLRFGITFVDYNNNLTRTPKKSGLWYKKFLEG